MTAAAQRGLAVVAAGAVVVAVLVVVVVGGGSSGHRLRAVFDSAQNVYAGQDVKIAGRRVGSVHSVRYRDGQALVGLDIDDAAWPLTRGTTAQIRFGTTVSVAERYIALHPAPAGPTLPDGALLTRADTITPVEFDQFFDIFDSSARDDVKHVMAEGAAGLGASGPALARGLHAAPGAFRATAGLLRGLGDDPDELSTLVAAGSRTARAVSGRDRELRGLLDGAAATFDEIAGRAGDVRDALARMPVTLRAARGTLGRTDRTLGRLEPLVADLRPGARELAGAASDARRAVAALRSVAPLGSATLRQATAAVPDVRRLLAKGTPFAGRLAGVLDKSVPALTCLRPYAPELAGWISTWAGFAQGYDDVDHYLRTLVIAAPIPPSTPVASATAVAAIPGLRYAFPRPPGLNAGASWLQPGCGITADSLEAHRDPETK